MIRSSGLNVNILPNISRAIGRKREGGREGGRERERERREGEREGERERERERGEGWYYYSHVSVPLGSALGYNLLQGTTGL